jgi:hypothetical protein
MSAAFTAITRFVSVNPGPRELALAGVNAAFTASSRRGAVDAAFTAILLTDTGDRIVNAVPVRERPTQQSSP